MNAILIDSDILIEISRGRDASILARWRELGLGNDLLLCSAITIAEVWRGARPSEHVLLERLFAALTCAPVDAEIGLRAGEFLRDYGKSHGLELGDALIAATASVHHLHLWTRNRKHYPMKNLSFY